MKLYHSSPSNKGSLFSIYPSDGKGAFLSIQNQTGWDVEKESGLYKNGDRCSIFLNFEILSNILFYIQKKKEYTKTVKTFTQTATCSFKYDTYVKPNSNVSTEYVEIKIDKTTNKQQTFTFNLKEGEIIYFVEYVKHLFKEYFMLDDTANMASRHKYNKQNTSTSSPDTHSNTPEPPEEDLPF